MLSRVADSIYWMCRYIERAENVARFVDVNLNLTLDLSLQEAHQWQPLVVTTGDSADFVARYGKATQESVMTFLAFDEANPNSIVSCLKLARENARTVREIISSEMWERVNQFYLMVRAAAASKSLDSPHAFFTEVKKASHLFAGVTATTMSHNEGWQFARMGMMVERADKTARILDVKYFILLPDVEYVGTPFDVILWSALLKSASAFEMYRKRYNRIYPSSVAEFLILDRDFPRSIRHCLIRVEGSLRAITGSGPGTFTNSAEQLLGRLRSELDYARIDDVIADGLHEFLDTFQAKLNVFGDAVFDTFFALRPVPKQAETNRVQP